MHGGRTANEKPNKKMLANSIRRQRIHPVFEQLLMIRIPTPITVPGIEPITSTPLVCVLVFQNRRYNIVSYCLRPCSKFLLFKSGDINIESCLMTARGHFLEGGPATSTVPSQRRLLLSITWKQNDWWLEMWWHIFFFEVGHLNGAGR